MQPDELFFIAEAVRHARSLPFSNAVRFINGMLLSLNAEHGAITDLRSTLNKMVASDQQLDLLQLGQMKLTLPDKPARRNRR